MNYTRKKSERILYLIVTLVMLFTMLAATPSLVLAAPADAVQVSSYSQLTAAFSNTSVTAISLTGNITVTANLTLKHNIAIYGQGRKIDLGAYKLNAGSYNLTLADRLEITSTASKCGSTITGTGRFLVEAGANVKITRTRGTYTDNLIDGFTEYIFEENSVFYASAETNRSESNKGTSQTAVIRSFPAKNFKVLNSASVTLVSDYSSSKSADHGSTALILRKPKGGQLNIDVKENAVLNITAYGTGLSSRDRAPVLILHEAVSGNTGVSYTTVEGTMNVTSNNGNGWYYQYIDYVTTTSDYFTVDGGEVNITAKNGESKDKTEYAAFESYGRNPTYVTVKNGGVMNIHSNGYRGMSLAGGGSYAEKNITVTDPGSKLSVYGYMWAIAAETQPTLSINALNGGEILLESAADDVGTVGVTHKTHKSCKSCKIIHCKSSKITSCFAGSTVYSVGPTAFKVDGSDSKLEIMHYGGEYGAIFADGYGVLNISVTNGGDMYVYSKNSGSDKAARRAAICAQSGIKNIHSILVDGTDSTLEVVNDNPDTCNDKSLYPRSAVAFSANTSGNITVSNGGNFLAQSNNPDSPTVALGGYGTDDTSGKLILNKPGKVDIKNNASTTSTSAVALRSTNYLQSCNKKSDPKVALDIRDASITVWPIGKGSAWPDSTIIDRWNNATFTAPNNVAVSTLPAVGVKGSTTFKLSSYGRIAAEGDHRQFFTVTFNANGGVPTPNAQTVEQGQKAIKPADPVKDGYVFNGWYAAADFSGNAWNFDNDTVTGDVTLYAKWEQKTQFYTVTFNANGGVPTPDAQTVEQGQKAIKPADPVKDGYVFDGWYVAADFSGSVWDFDNDTVTGNITLYAKWTQRTSYTVVFVVNGGNPVPPFQTVLSGEKVNKPTDPTRDGYVFDGWYLDWDFSGSVWDFDNDTVTGNTILYAKWTPTTQYYTVTFDALGGVPTPDSQIVEYGQKVIKPADPIKDGYVLIEWYPTADFSGSAWNFNNNTVTGDVTLYARWLQPIRLGDDADESE